MRYKGQAFYFVLTFFQRRFCAFAGGDIKNAAILNIYRFTISSSSCFFESFAHGWVRVT
jgi:hypothetical protein